MNRRLILKLLAFLSITGFGIFGIKRCNMKNDVQDLPRPIKVDEKGWGAFLNQWSDEATLLARKQILIYGISSSWSLEGFINKLREKKISFDPEIFKGGLGYPSDNLNKQKLIQTRLKEYVEVINKLEASYSKEERLFYGHDFEFEVLLDGLRYPPADESMIVAAEQRLQVSLPESYKEFLRVSNGFLTTYGRLLPIEEIGWLKNKDPELLETWGASNQIETINIPDELYFVYGKQQDSIDFRREYLESCLLIGNDYGIRNGANWLLNPEIQLEPSEWEVLFMETSGIGAIRYRTFKELMEVSYPFDIENLQLGLKHLEEEFKKPKE